MSDSKVQISIPEELIRSMVGAAVVQQLGNPQEVAVRMMSEVLLRKCKRPGSDSYGPEKPLIEWLFCAEAERIAREEVKAFMETSVALTVALWTRPMSEIELNIEKGLSEAANAEVGRLAIAADYWMEAFKEVFEALVKLEFGIDYECPDCGGVSPHHRGTCRLRDALAGGTVAKREEILWAKIRGEGSDA